ncbi:hypothetical protein H4Q26_009585 [Puccinia striiformis f. sp. tritici PST-130]|nr:hypothetical protein H4Q26_009585 [Puccinia striiformis f. sp. tritici PST-130]
MSDITLHTTEHAEALTPHSRLADLAEQLCPCGFQETPLIIKAKSNAGEAIIHMFSEIKRLVSASSCDQFTKSSANILSAVAPPKPDGSIVYATLELRGIARLQSHSLSG